MKIGVVCEGPTDFVTMKSFFQRDLSLCGHDIDFTILQPALDNTLPGGWSEVLYWLEANPLQMRMSLYRTGQSLFAEEDESMKFDALIFQLDTDIIGEVGFKKFISDRGIQCLAPADAAGRAEFIRGVLLKIAGLPTLIDSVDQGEIPVAIVESSETWAVASEAKFDSPEEMSAEEVRNNFGRLVALSSGQTPQETYSSINKKVRTRERMCKYLCKTGSPSGSAPNYDLALDHIKQVRAGV